MQLLGGRAWRHRGPADQLGVAAAIRVLLWPAVYLSSREPVSRVVESARMGMERAVSRERRWTNSSLVATMVVMRRPKWLRYEDPFSHGPPIRFEYDRVVGAVLAVMGAVLFIVVVVWLIRSSR